MNHCFHAGYFYLSTLGIYLRKESITFLEALHHRYDNGDNRPHTSISMAHRLPWPILNPDTEDLAEQLRSSGVPLAMFEKAADHLPIWVNVRYVHAVQEGDPVDGQRRTVLILPCRETYERFVVLGPVGESIEKIEKALSSHTR